MLDYRDLAIYIVRYLQELLKKEYCFLIKPYSLEKKIMSVFKLDFYSLSEEQIYSFSYRLLMDMFKIEFYNGMYKRLKLIKSNCLNKRNLYIFVDYILKILETDEESFKNDCIKLDILIILLYLSKNNCEKLVLAYGYFNICINELQKIYPNIECPNKTIFDDEIIEDYNTEKVINFKHFLSEAQSYYNKNNLYEKINEINKLLNQIISKGINSKNIDTYIEKYIEHLNTFLKEYFNRYSYQYKKDKNDKKDKEDKENNAFEDKKENKGDGTNEEFNEFKHILFYLTDIDEIICYLDTNGFELNLIENFKEKYEPIFVSKTKEEDLTNDLKSIINTDEFEENLKKILESNAIQDYLKKKRQFSNEIDAKKREYYEFSFINEINEKGNLLNFSDVDLDDLEKEYNSFMNYFKKKGWFKTIVTFKYLPGGLRAFVNQTMLIAVNPLFIKQSNLLKNDNIKKRKILFSYLIFLFVHEIILKIYEKKKL